MRTSACDSNSIDPIFEGMEGSAVRFQGGGFGPDKLRRVSDAHMSLLNRLVATFKNAKLSREGALKVFSAFDGNGDGLISPQELQNGLRKLGIALGAEDTISVVELADADSNGRIDYNEFLSLCMPSRGPYGCLL